MQTEIIFYHTESHSTEQLFSSTSCRKMRIPLIAISIWMFICMVVLGVFGYAYVLWSQYWRTSEEKRQLLMMRSVQYLEQSMLNDRHISGDIVPNVARGNNSEDIPTDKLRDKIHTYKSQLLIQLRKAQLVAGNVIFHKEKEETNIYKVKFKRQKIKTPHKNRHDLICELQESVKVEMLRENLEPFKSLGYDKYFPRREIFENFPKRNTCAIVSSAGSMYKSKLGKEIGMYKIFLHLLSI